MPRVHRIYLRPSAEDRRRWIAQAQREGLSLEAWLAAAAELALARGSTR